jgi:hypothetical protein
MRTTNMDNVIYLQSYLVATQVLEYSPKTRSYRLLTSGELPDGVALEMGKFIELKGQVFGLYRSSMGPVLFWNDSQVVAQKNATHATLSADAPTQNRFALSHHGQIVLTVEYLPPHGQFTNPYDTEPEDVDFFALITTALVRDQFFIHYTSGPVPVATAPRPFQFASGAIAPTEQRWKVIGRDAFAKEDYPVSTHAAEAEALAAAKAHYAEIQRDQPDSQSGGQAGLQDHVYILAPTGHQTRYP